MGEKERAFQIMASAAQLRELLEVEEPVTIRVRDPSGLSEISPLDGVTVQPLRDDNPDPMLVAVDPSGIRGVLVGSAMLALIALNRQARVSRPLEGLREPLMHA